MCPNCAGRGDKCPNCNGSCKPSAHGDLVIIYNKHYCIKRDESVYTTGGIEDALCDKCAETYRKIANSSTDDRTKAVEVYDRLFSLLLNLRAKEIILIIADEK